jgi:hypothetical protein
VCSDGPTRTKTTYVLNRLPWLTLRSNICLLFTTSHPNILFHLHHVASKHLFPSSSRCAKFCSLFTTLRPVRHFLPNPRRLFVTSNHSSLRHITPQTLVLRVAPELSFSASSRRNRTFLSCSPRPANYSFPLRHVCVCERERERETQKNRAAAPRGMSPTLLPIGDS